MIVRHSTSRLAALGTFSGAGERSLFDKYENAEMRGFGTFGALNTAAAADAVITKVKLAYGAGGLALKIFPVDFQDLIAKQSPTLAFFLPGVFVSPSTAAITKTYRELGEKIDDWASRKYRWAQAGQRDDGTPYSWKQWGELGKVYLGSVIYTAGLPVTNGFIVNAARAVKDFIDRILTLFQPTEWPTWAKVAAGLAGVAAVAYVVNTVRGPLR